MYSQIEPNAIPKHRSAHMRCLGCATGIFVGNIDETYTLHWPVICSECGQGHVIEMHAIEEFEFFRLAPAA